MGFYLFHDGFYGGAVGGINKKLFGCVYKFVQASIAALSFGGKAGNRCDMRFLWPGNGSIRTPRPMDWVMNFFASALVPILIKLMTFGRLESQLSKKAREPMRIVMSLFSKSAN